MQEIDQPATLTLRLAYVTFTVVGYRDFKPATVTNCHVFLVKIIIVANFFKFWTVTEVKMFTHAIFILQFKN